MPDLDLSDPSPGTYVLGLGLDRASIVRIGALGPRSFGPGFYLYVGSARGPGGLRARLAHHRRRAERPHWHVDYFRGYASVICVWTARGRDRMECDWAGRLLEVSAVTGATPGFGASDCGCATHLLEAPAIDSGLLRTIGGRLQPAVLHHVRWQ